MSTTTPQARGLTRADIQEHDLSVPGREVIQDRVDSVRTRRSFVTSTRVKKSSTFWKDRWSTRSTASHRQGSAPARG